ncbi:MAG: hypothetical protein WBP81_00645 [Solirubrobacteraceae bacterium]
MATAGDVTAPSQIEQSADVGRGRSQLVLSTFWIAAMEVVAFMAAAAVSSGGS